MPHPLSNNIFRRILITDLETFFCLLLKVKLLCLPIHRVVGDRQTGRHCDVSSYSIMAQVTVNVKESFQWQYGSQERNSHSPGGNLLLSISIATTLTINTHMGQSSMSFSDLTNATADKHWVSNRRRSGYARLSSRFTFDWNFFMSNNYRRG